MSENTSIPPEQGDSDREAALRKLVLRLLREPVPTNTEPQLLVETLPEPLPVELPLPEGSRIVGSIVHSRENFTVVLDTDLSPEDTLNLYRDRLHTAGWQELEQPRNYYSGFVAFDRPLYAMFYRSDRGPLLSISLTAGMDAPTDVRLSLNMRPNTSDLRPLGRRRGRTELAIFPTLIPPPASQKIGGGGGGNSDGEEYHKATIITELDLVSITAHYARQLEQAGWSQSDAGQSGLISWSRWEFRDEMDEPWQGLFFVLEQPGIPNEYFLFLQVKLAV